MIIDHHHSRQVRLAHFFRTVEDDANTAEHDDLITIIARIKEAGKNRTGEHREETDQQIAIYENALARRFGNQK